MELCLYHPEYGYYAQTPTQVGRAGDFFTSVSCGPLFGILIAEAILAWWREENTQGPWRIMEVGPNNAALAKDVLTHLRDHASAAFQELEFVTIDPMPLPRKHQQQVLAEFGSRVRCLDSAQSLTQLPCFVIANEVFDAFPCHCIERRDGSWQEIWIESPSPSAALREVHHPTSTRYPAYLDQGDFAEGYRTEFRDDVSPFLQPLRDSMTYGKMLFFDYGFAEPEYYDPQRVTGTMRAFRKHQASEDFFAEPGANDLTAHVDFTAISRNAIKQGLTISRFEPQEFFLSRLAQSLLTQKLWRDEWQVNLQTLIHPAHLGGKFHAYELSWNKSTSHDATALRRLALASI